MTDGADTITGGGAAARDPVFIRHASQYLSIAEEVRAAIDAVGIRCWIAPREARPGDFCADRSSTG